MIIRPEELRSEGYTEDAVLAHDDLVPFVRQHFRRYNLFSLFFMAFNGLLVAMFVFYLIREKEISVWQCIFYCFGGCSVFFIFLLPLHELIHGLFYKLAGAERIQFTLQWKKMIFFCTADRFVADRKEFLWIALSPFVLISMVLIIGMLLANTMLFWVLFGALLLHTGGCYGDFGLANYFYNNRRSQPCTFDDAVNKKTYFYVKRS